MFARFVPDERVGVLKVDGVVQIISNNGIMSAIPDEEIDSIRVLVDSGKAAELLRAVPQTRKSNGFGRCPMARVPRQTQLVVVLSGSGGRRDL